MWFDVAAMPSEIGSSQPIRTDDSSRSGASVPFAIDKASSARTVRLAWAPVGAAFRVPERVPHTDSALGGFARLS